MRLHPTAPFGHTSLVSPNANLMVFPCFLDMRDAHKSLCKGVNGLTETNV